MLSQSLNFSDQAVWYLNGFWTEGAQTHSEKVWEYAHKFIELQYGKPKYYGAKGKKQEVL